MQDPDVHPCSRITAAIRVLKFDPRETTAHGGGSREETEGFFDDGDGVRKLVY